MSFWKKMLIVMIGGALLLSATFMVGCAEDPLQGGSTNKAERFASFSATPSQIVVGTQVAISGIVTDSSGNPLEGRQITLSVVPSTAGYFLPAIDTTSSTGAFGVQFIPLDTGSATFYAVTSKNVSTNFISTIVASGSSQSGGWKFAFTVTPSVATANGEDISEVEVDITNSSGAPATNGTIIRIEAGERFTDLDGDGYFTENVDRLVTDINGNNIWDRIGSAPKTATVSNGKITFDYTSGIIAGLMYLRATVVVAGTFSYAEHPMVLRPSAEIASIALTSDWNEIQVKATGGIEFAHLTAVCFDAYGNRVQSDLPINFFIVYGPGGGERLTISEFDSGQTSFDTITALTNVAGEATITMLSGIKSGTVMLRARKGTVYSNSTIININAGPPFEISVGVSPCNIRGWDKINVPATIVALVDDKYGNPVADTTEIYFSTDEGMVGAASITVGGVGQVVYRSGDPRDDGLALIKAETSGGTIKDSTILIVSGPAAFINILSYAHEMNATTEDYTDIWIDVRDVNDNFVVGGTEIEILLSDGTILTGSTADGCAGSNARLRYRASSLTRDYVYSVPDNGIGRVVTGTIYAGGVVGTTASISITLHTGITNTTKSTITVDGTVAPGSSVPVSLVIKDRAGNPLGGHLLVPDANLGTMVPSSLYTNAYGEATFTYTAPAAIGNDYIMIQDLDPLGQVRLTKKVKIDITE